jgi:hypothetical protein
MRVLIVYRHKLEELLNQPSVREALEAPPP